MYLQNLYLENFICAVSYEAVLSPWWQITSSFRKHDQGNYISATQALVHQLDPANGGLQKGDKRRKIAEGQDRTGQGQGTHLSSQGARESLRKEFSARELLDRFSGRWISSKLLHISWGQNHKIAALAIVFAVKQSHDCLDGWRPTQFPNTPEYIVITHIPEDILSHLYLLYRLTFPGLLNWRVGFPSRAQQTPFTLIQWALSRLVYLFYTKQKWHNNCVQLLPFTQKVFAIEFINSIIGVAVIFKLNKSEALQNHCSQ